MPGPAGQTTTAAGHHRGHDRHSTAAKSSCHRVLAICGALVERIENESRGATMRSCALIAIVYGVLFVSSPQLAAAAEQPPNIVFILVDDLGWADLGCYGGSLFETPNIDRLAESGVRFTDFYAACPVCSPTRAAIQSGQYQSRLRITDFIPGHYRPFEKLVVPFNADHLPLAIETPAELLSRAGYVSGYFGKWHLGNPPGRQPADQGYDDSDVFTGHWFPKGAARKADKQYGTDRVAASADDFMSRHRKDPFLLFLSPYAVHIPLQAKEEVVAKYEAKLGGKSGPEGPLPSPIYAAMVEHVDDMVGDIIAKLEALKLRQRTVVILTSDNGGLYKTYTGLGDRVTDNGPLRGEKGTVYEGGIRVPLIVNWPGVVPEGTVCNEPTISIDFWPTFAEIAGVGVADTTQVTDGVSLVPLLKDPASHLDREAIFWHYPHYHHMDPAGAVRSRKWKFVRHYDGSPSELYDLTADLGETRNVLADHSDVAQHLRQLHDKFLDDTSALMPTENAKFDPARSGEWWNRRTGKRLPQAKEKQARSRSE